MPTSVHTSSSLDLRMWKGKRILCIPVAHQAVKNLENLDKVLRKQLTAAREKLEESPQHYGKRLKEIDLWSLRSGKFRINMKLMARKRKFCHKRVS
jgi:mRNA-degrading endonuclease RelE of RelBE toxin-antitoxin system